MARRCELTGKSVLSGNNVSHAHNKTRRRYLPNIQRVSIYSEGQHVWTKLASKRGLRTAQPAVACARQRRRQHKRMLEDKAGYEWVLAQWTVQMSAESAAKTAASTTYYGGIYVGLNVLSMVMVMTYMYGWVIYIYACFRSWSPSAYLMPPTTQASNLP